MLVKEQHLKHLLWFCCLIPDGSTAVLESCLAGSYDSAPRYYPREIKTSVHTADLYMEVYSIFIHHSHKLETNQMALTTEQIFKTKVHSLDVPTQY